MEAPAIQDYISAISNLMNAILGGAIVGLPFALANLGYVIYLVALFLVACLALFSINLLLKACDLHKTSSYEKLARLALGKPGIWYTCVIIYFHTMISMCMYMFIVLYEGPTFIRGIIGQASTCEHLSNDGNMVWYFRGDLLAVMVIWLIVMPLAAAKNIDFLGKSSAIGMLAMVVFLIIIVIYKFIIECPVRRWSGAAKFFENYNNTLNKSNCSLGEVFEDHEIEFYKQSENQICDASAAVMNNNTIFAIPTMLFAFQCHASCLPVYAEFRNGDRMKMLKVAFIAISIVFIMYNIVAYFTYFTWYNLTLGEVLMMYSSLDAGDPKILVARGCVLLCVIFSAPLLHFPCRKAQTQLFWDNTVEFSWARHLGLMIINLGLVSVIVCFAPGIQTLFGYGGAITANSLEIILPCLFYYRLGIDPKTSFVKIACVIIGVLGVVLMISNTLLIALKT